MDKITKEYRKDQLDRIRNKGVEEYKHMIKIYHPDGVSTNCLNIDIKELEQIKKILLK